jgi:EpsI family protein
MTRSHAVLAWVAAVAMLAVAALSQFARPVAMPAATPLAQSLPERFGSWRVDPDHAPIAPTPNVQEDLDRIYDEIVSRTYVDDTGRRVMLVLAYGGDQSDSMKAHRQEVCYTAQGFEVRNVVSTRLALDGGHTAPVVRMHARKGARSEPVSYWLTMGEHIVLGRAERLLVQIRYGLTGRIPDGLLVRVSSLDADAQAAYATQDDFVRQLIGVVSPEVRKRLGVAL